MDPKSADGNFDKILLILLSEGIRLLWSDLSFRAERENDPSISEQRTIEEDLRSPQTPLKSDFPLRTLSELEKGICRRKI